MGFIPTTILMSFFQAGYGVVYEPIHALGRWRKPSPTCRDGLRFFLIIFKDSDPARRSAFCASCAWVSVAPDWATMQLYL